MFPAVTIGGPGPTASSRQFTLRNTGTDCLRIESIERNDPFAVTAQSIPFPAGLAAGQSMTVTVTFAPTVAGTWTSRTLPITRTPPLGADKLTCSGTAAPHDTAAPTWPSGAVLTADQVTTNSAIVPANRVRQVVVPSRPRLRAVEVALMNGNPGYGGDQVTLTVLAADGAVLVKTSAAIPQGFNGYWRFELPGSGTAVTPGEPLTLLLEDTGRNAFWWKYTGGNPYPAGPAYFGDNVFGDHDFLFRTYGSS